MPEKYPGLQAKHPDDPAAEYVPALHELQPPDPAMLHVPVEIDE